MKINQLQFKKVWGEDNSCFWYEASTPFGPKYIIQESSIWYWTTEEKEEVIKVRETDFESLPSFDISKQICQNHFEGLANKCLENK